MTASAGVELVLKVAVQRAHLQLISVLQATNRLTGSLLTPDFNAQNQN